MTVAIGQRPTDTVLVYRRQVVTLDDGSELHLEWRDRHWFVDTARTNGQWFYDASIKAVGQRVELFPKWEPHTVELAQEGRARCRVVSLSGQTPFQAGDHVELTFCLRDREKLITDAPIVLEQVVVDAIETI